MRTDVQDVVAAFGTPESPVDNVVSKDDVVSWCASEDLETLGALHAYLTSPQYAHRVNPQLTDVELWALRSKYYSSCIANDASGEWAHGRYEALWEFTGWYSSIWRQQTSDSNVRLRQLGKDWLRSEYLGASPEGKEAIVNGALEHLFERLEISKFFGDWKDDPALTTAYSDAEEWVRCGGKSHFHGKQA